MEPSEFRAFPVAFWLPRILWSIVACGMLAVGILLFTLTVLSDTKWVKDSLISMLEGTAGGPIQIETLNLNLFPSPAIHLSGLSFETHDPGIVAFHANQVEVGIGWRSLWDKKLFINRAMIDQPELTLEVPLITKEEEPVTRQLPSIQEFGIRNGILHLIHTAPPPAQKMALDWEAIQLSIMDVESEGSALIHLSAQIPEPQPSSALTLEGTITLLDKDDTSSLKELSGFPAVEVRGQIEISQFHLGRLVQFLRGHALETPIHTQANFQGTFTFTVQKEQDLLDFQSFQIALDEWSFAGQGSIANVLHELPWLKVSGSTQPIAIERLPDLVPDDWVPTEFDTFLRDHQIAGMMALQRGSIGGPLDGKGSWEAQGTIGLEGGQYLPAPGQPLMTKVGATVTFAPSALQISQVRGTITPFTITAPEAKLALAEGTVRLSIPAFQISNGDWNLDGKAEFINRRNAPPALTVSGSALPISIQHLANILPEPWRPDSVHTILTERDIDGEMELLTGSVNWIGDEANTVMSEGVIRVANGHVLVDPHHPPLTHLSGSVVFGANLVRVLNAKATLENSKLLVKEATLEWTDSDIFMDLQGEGLLSAHDVHQALLRDPRSQSFSEPLSLYPDVQGDMHLSTRITGPLTNPSQMHILDGVLVLDGMHLSTTGNRLPLHHITGHLSFDEQQVHIHRFNGIVGKSPVNIKGQWSFRKDSKASNLAMKGLWSSNDLQSLLPSIIQTFSAFEGQVGTTLTLSGPNLRPEYHAELDLTNMAMATKGLFHKPSGIPAVLKAKGSIQENKSIRMTKSTLSIPPYSLEAQGQLSWADRTYIRGFLQTQSGTGAMFPPGVIVGEKKLGLSSLGITWGLEGKNWDWTTWSMKGKIEGNNRNPESTTSKTNKEFKSATFQWAQKNQRGKGELTLKDIPIESLLVPRSDTPSPLTGTVSLVTSLHMGIGSQELIQRSLTGKGHVQLEKGLIQTGPVLSKILGILNVPSLLMGKVNLSEEGLPYDRIEGSFAIENGLLSSQDLALKSPVIKLTAAGTYDLPTEKLNGMVAVSPFGAYSGLLKDIPLFGSLMKGDRKGLMTALFEVKGPRTKPEITYLPLESLTGGLKGFAQFAVDVLKNVVTLPISDTENQNADRTSK
ncbi:MAG: AsmA-like C-terminal domain-containing protein [Nitrospirales bacterium]